MKEILNSPVFVIALTIIVYLFCEYIQKKTKLTFLNPVMTSILFLIIGLKYMNISFDSYSKGTYPIKLMLDASVVALAFPLYQQWETIRKDYKRILLCMTAGSIIGILSVMFFAWLFGASQQVILSLVPKSITTPIAIKVSESLGGIPPLTAAIVITVGIFGSIVGVEFLKLMKINKPESVGLAMGTAAHGLGTARVTPMGERYTAMAGLAIALNGLLTAIFAPFIAKWFLVVLHYF